jgi:hypothetical protein
LNPILFALTVNFALHLTHIAAAKAKLYVSESTWEKLGEPAQEKEPWKTAGNLRHSSTSRKVTSRHLELRADSPTNLVTVHRTRQNLPLSSEKRLSTANYLCAKNRNSGADAGSPEGGKSTCRRWPMRAGERSIDKRADPADAHLDRLSRQIHDTVNCASWLRGD